MSSIAVIIPTYNRIDTIPGALDSVLDQTHPPDEIIVVDDGSTDGTAELLPEKYPSVKVLRQQQAGVSSARNRGVASAESEWIAFLDSDDLWMPEKLERQMQAIDSNPGTVLCHTNEIWIRNGRRVNAMKKHGKSGGWIFQDCLPLCAISPSSVLIRRDLLDSLGGFDPSLPACEDYDLWLRICARHPVLYLPDSLITKYGGHEDQLSRKYWGMDRFRTQALEKLLKDTTLDLKPEDYAAAVQVLAKKLTILEAGARKRGKVDDAEAYRRRRNDIERLHPGSAFL